ncbi:MAG: HAMP domain-containing sensor histidine kinase [Calditrichia bacterium]
MWRRFKQNTIKLRIILIFSIINILLVVVFARLGYRTVYQIYTHQLSDQVKTLAAMTGSRLDVRNLPLIIPQPQQSMAAGYYQNWLREQVEQAGISAAFIFDSDYRILVHSSETGPQGEQDLSLLLNRQEIRKLSPSRSVTSLPFKGLDGVWYMWGFYRLTGEYWLGIRENANRLAAIEKLWRYFMLIGLAGVAVTLLAGLYLAKTIARPVDKLIGFSRELGRGELKTPVPSDIKGELQVLAGALDSMRSDISRGQKEKEEMLAQIAHEIRNPLGGIELLAGLAKEDWQREGNDPAYLNKILKEIGGLKELISNFLKYSRIVPAKPQWVRMEAAVKETGRLIQSDLERKKIALNFENDSALQQVYFDPQHFRQILLNLFTNSTQALPDGGKIKVSVARNGSCARIMVSDNGSGIDPQQISRIFEPFFTTKKGGTGLGLAVSRKLCEENHARLRVESKTGQGALLVIEKSLDAFKGEK